MSTAESLALGITCKAGRATELLADPSHWDGPNEPGPISLSLVTQQFLA